MLLRLVYTLCALAAGSAEAQLVNLGIPANGLHKGSIAVGVLPDWSHEGPTDVNKALGGAISVIGDYINMSPSDYSCVQMDYHIPEILQLARSSGVKAVYAPAVIYGASLETWTPAMTKALADKCNEVSSQGVVIWLRLLFEMNGGWMSYGLQPTQFLQIWKDVTAAVRAESNTTLMLWSPNVFGGSVTDPTQGYASYWPGEQYVDLAGLSYYSFGIDKTFNQAPDSGAFKSLFGLYYNLLNPTSLGTSSSNTLSLTQGVPVVISETSAPFYYVLNSTSPYFSQAGDTDIAGPWPNISTFTPSLSSPPAYRSDDELYIKASWFVQLSSNVTAAMYPNLKAVSLFNYFKRSGNDGSVPTLVDFRSVGGNATVEAWFRGSIGNQTAFDLGYGGATQLRLSTCLALVPIALMLLVL